MLTKEQIDAMVRDAGALETCVPVNAWFAADCAQHIKTLASEVERMKAVLARIAAKERYPAITAREALEG